MSVLTECEGDVASSLTDTEGAVNGDGDVGVNGNGDGGKCEVVEKTSQDASDG